MESVVTKKQGCCIMRHLASLRNVKIIHLINIMLSTYPSASYAVMLQTESNTRCFYPKNSNNFIYKQLITKCGTEYALDKVSLIHASTTAVMKTIMNNILNAMAFANAGSFSEFEQMLHQNDAPLMEGQALEHARTQQDVMTQINVTHLFQA